MKEEVHSLGEMMCSHYGKKVVGMTCKFGEAGRTGEDVEGF